MNLLRRFAKWWVGELLDVLPQRLRGRPAHFIALNADATQLDTGLAGRSDEIVVRLPEDLSLRRTVSLPLAAERNLSAVLGFEMDRYTPFMAGDVYYDFTVLAKDPERRVLQVALTVVPRSAVAPFLQTLRGRGIDPCALEAQGRRLPLQDDEQHRRASAWPVRTLGATAVVLLLAAFAVPLVQKMQVLERLERDIGGLRKDVASAGQARKDLERFVAEENALIERRSQRPTAMRMVHELTRLLPDSTWLSHLDLNGSRLRIRGESSNASEVLKAIERSALFTDASFDGSVTRDAGSVRERFAISASVRPAGKSAP